MSVEILEPHANWAIAILESGGHEPVLHLSHLSADGNHQSVGGTGSEHRVPSTSYTFVHRPGPEHVGGAATSDDNCLGFEHPDLVLSDAEPDGAGDAARIVSVRQEMRDRYPLVNILRTHCLPSGFGGDRLDRLTVYRNLPTPNPLVFSVVLFPNGQAPLFQKVNRRVNMPANIVDQVLPRQTHHVVDYILDEVFRRVPPIPLPHVAVDGGESFSGCPTTLYDRFFNNHNFEVFAPILCLECRAASGHTAAYD